MTLQRVVFDTSRAAEFLDRRALQAQTGQPADRFGDVVIKELVDNALDAGEAVGSRPEIDLKVQTADNRQVVAVSDNGPGISADVVERILNFDVLVSDKAAYRSVTRGLQGNAWKTLLGIPYALGITEPVVIEAQGVRHAIAVASDPGGNVVVKHDRSDSDRTTGTQVRVPIPVELEIDARRWARAFAVVNPHAEIRFGGAGYQDNEGRSEHRGSYKPTVNGVWRKPLPTDKTSVHWYDTAALKRQVFAHIGTVRQGGPEIPLGKFIRTFDNLSSTTKAKAVAQSVSDIKHLSDFQEAPDQIDTLLVAMRSHAREVKPHKLGSAGKEHMESCLADWYGVQKSWYKRIRTTQDGMPWVLEVAVAATKEPGEVFYAANYSPTFADPLGNFPLDAGEVSTTGAESFLRQCDAYPSDDNGHRRAAIVHVICPGLEFTDKGKTQIGVPR